MFFFSKLEYGVDIGNVDDFVKDLYYCIVKSSFVMVLTSFLYGAALVIRT